VGNTLIYIGIGLIVAGIAYKYGLLGWFGNLPGDIRYKGEHTLVFIPFTSMVLISIVLSLVLHFLNR